MSEEKSTIGIETCITPYQPQWVEEAPIICPCARKFSDRARQRKNTATQANKRMGKTEFMFEPSTKQGPPKPEAAPLKHPHGFIPKDPSECGLRPFLEFQQAADRTQDHIPIMAHRGPLCHRSQKTQQTLEALGSHLNARS